MIKRTGGTQRGRQPRRVLRSSTKPKPVEPPKPAESSSKPKRRRRRAGADPWTTPRRKPRNPNPRPRPPPPTHYTCRICADEKPVEDFIKRVPLSKALRTLRGEVPRFCLEHLTRNPRQKTDPVCKECIGQSMAAKLDTLGARRVSNGCLEPGCTTFWDFHYLMMYFPIDALEKYNEGMMTIWKEESPTMTCLKEGCGAIGLLDALAPGYPQVECPECKTRMCALCKVTWHTGLTCAEHRVRHVDDQMTAPERDTLKLMQTKNGKRCPNCFMVIEKDGGCDSMFCEGCRTYFNWATAASADPRSKPAPGSTYGYSVPVVCEIDGPTASGVHGLLTAAVA